MIMNGDKLEKALEIAADMQTIVDDDVPDELGKIINECADIELTEEELDYVSAATAMPKQNFKNFMEKLTERANKI